MSHLSEFDGKSLQDVGKGELDLGKLDTEEEKQAKEKVAEQLKPLLERVKAALTEEVAEVRITDRLTDSPACVVVADHDMGAQMRRILEQAGQKLPDSKPIFELNPEHPLVKKLEQETNETRFGDLAHILFDQANLAEGAQLQDPAAYVQRLNKLLLELSN
jgi:molecular chaperone HtpG